MQTRYLVVLFLLFTLAFVGYGYYRTTSDDQGGAMPAVASGADETADTMPAPTASTPGVPSPTSSQLPKLSPNPGAASQLCVANLATRALLRNRRDAIVVEFEIVGPGQKQVIVRGLGPSLLQQGVSRAISNPSVALRQGARLIAQNDNYTGDTGEGALAGSLVPPRSEEAGLVTSLGAGRYAAVLEPGDDVPGIGLLDIYVMGGDVNTRAASLAVEANAAMEEDVLLVSIGMGPCAAEGTVTTRAPISGSGNSVLADANVTLVTEGKAVIGGDNWPPGLARPAGYRATDARFSYGFKPGGAYVLFVDGKKSEGRIRLELGG
ncbi:MAG: hypothetical protein ACFHX7_06300 [Pseudomonadota bacterium]